MNGPQESAKCGPKPVKVVVEATHFSKSVGLKSAKEA